MGYRRVFFLVVAVLLFPFCAAAQRMPERDPRALAILQQSLKGMGGSVPPDSEAMGTVVLVEGSATENGTVLILSRGTDQTLETFQLPSGPRSIIYSSGHAREIRGSSSRELQLERAVTSECPDFPVALIAASLQHPEAGLQYVGQEELGGAQVHHLRIWSAFPSQPKLAHLEGFSSKDLWVDAASGLARKLSYEQREALGAAPNVPVGVTYSDYRNVGGVLYPFLIQKSFNGTPWATISITKVTFNNGLTDADFPVER
jgi:hypothetical protein